MLEYVLFSLDEPFNPWVIQHRVSFVTSLRESSRSTLDFFFPWASTESQNKRQWHVAHGHPDLSSSDISLALSTVDATQETRVLKRAQLGPGWWLILGLPSMCDFVKKKVAQHAAWDLRSRPPFELGPFLQRCQSLESVTLNSPGVNVFN